MTMTGFPPRENREEEWWWRCEEEQNNGSVCRERLDIVKQQPVRFGLSLCKRRIVYGMREEDHLNFLTTGCQKNKTKQQVKKKRPTKTVLDGKESGDTSFATLTKVAAGSGKRKQQDGSNSFTGPWLRGSLTKQRMLEVSRYCWMNSFLCICFFIGCLWFYHTQIK